MSVDKAHHVTMMKDNQFDDEESAFSANKSANFGNSVTTIERERRECKTLTKNENVAVCCTRTVVLLTLVVATVLVSVTVYRYSHQHEYDKFVDEFSDNAATITRAVHDTIQRTMTSLDALTVAITSHAIDSGSTFPFVTVPNFEVLTSTTVTQSLLYTFYMPLVNETNRLEYEAYTVANQNQLLDSYTRQSSLQSWQDSRYGYDNMAKLEEIVTTPLLDMYSGINVDPFDLQMSSKISNIKDNVPVTSGLNLYFPLSQVSPAMPFPSILNRDHYNEWYLKDGIDTVLERKMAVIHDISSILSSEDTDHVKVMDMIFRLGQGRHDEMNAGVDGPTSPVLYPVFNSFAPQRREVVGIIQSALHWHGLFTGLLPPHVKAVVCVVESTRGDLFTYKVTGSNAEFIGYGDLHDPQYDNYKLQQSIADTATLQEHSEEAMPSYTYAGLDSEWNDYTLSVYPTDELKAAYMTSNPIIYTLAVAAVFLFTTFVFVFYDCLVELRQRKLFNQAVKSSAVVSSLFPAAVRYRLYNEELQDVMHRRCNHEPLRNGVDREYYYRRHGDDTVREPIAENFHSATVFFADIVGFTKWSSCREPKDVFLLLETLYGEFDILAKRRNVFKVETIGDSYMAVTGVPEAQSDHAVIMAKFARDCLSTIKKVTLTLVGTLGECTQDLTLRIGIHSGAVTAGVLRGDRARFQLFGDTVNTASRMEATSLPGRIHCSQATADALTARGKCHWLEPCKDKVQPKGKEMMQTYYINVCSSSSSGMGTPPGLRPLQRVSVCVSTTSHMSDDGSTSARAVVDRDGYYRKLYPSFRLWNDVDGSYDKSIADAGNDNASHYDDMCNSNTMQSI